MEIQDRLVSLLVLPICLASYLTTILYVVFVRSSFDVWFWEAFHHSPWAFYPSVDGVRFLAGPYSLLWWILYSPAFLGRTFFFSYLTVASLAVAVVLYRHSASWALLWVTVQVWAVALDPVDFWILALTFLGLQRWQFLAVAVVAKLPLGSEVSRGLEVWRWLFTAQDSLQASGNWPRYLVLGFFWLVSLLLVLRARQKTLPDYG